LARAGLLGGGKEMPGWVVRTPQKMWEGLLRVDYDGYHTAEVTIIALALGRAG